MEQIVWGDLLIIIITIIALVWFVWSVSLRKKNKRDDEWEITIQSPSPITNHIKKGCRYLWEWWNHHSQNIYLT